jgi:inner membrane protein
LHLNRNFPQQWCGEKRLEESSFGINLLTQLDGYQKTFRSVNYAILILALTFLIFFFVEMIHKIYVHPVQYLLIGLGLVIYYTLLLSFTEYFGFDIAYLISSVMTLLLILLYSRSILRPKRASLTITGTLMLLYAFLFTIIQLTDYALMMGSIGLFIILATIMYYSKKVDWTRMKI